MSGFEIEPADEACPDCGSTKHRECKRRIKQVSLPTPSDSVMRAARKIGAALRLEHRGDPWEITVAQILESECQVSELVEWKKRAETLLRASFDMFRTCEDAHFVISPMETTVFYDEADCDGSCLLDDISHHLEIERAESVLRSVKGSKGAD